MMVSILKRKYRYWMSVGDVSMFVLLMNVPIILLSSHFDFPNEQAQLVFNLVAVIASAFACSAYILSSHFTKELQELIDLLEKKEVAPEQVEGSRREVKA